MNTLKSIILLLVILISTSTHAQDHSIAREWNEVLLQAIRGDFARPTIHARNLYHTSIAMYDAWAVYDESADTYFLGKSMGNYNCPFDGISQPENIKDAQEATLSYAVYRLLSHRFQYSPSANMTLFSLTQFMQSKGYDADFVDTDYSDGNPAALGNYLAEQLIAAGLVDGANEADGYANQYYTPVNNDLDIANSDSTNLSNPNRWQPIFLTNFIDQSGNPQGETPEFLSPEWGNVVPFALKEEDKSTFYRNGNTYHVYHDPGDPDFIDVAQEGAINEAYRWGFSLVSVWAAHHDPSDGVMIDISPASIGNISDFPETSADFPDFYNLLEGGDPGNGHTLNPITGMPYETQMVPRGDYSRVLAEFWADGPDSETPPGHWFSILNTVNDHPLATRKWNGQGEDLGALEWDVKAYFTLGGAVHDAAIAAWSVKGWYDYIRPVSAIRFMAEMGQSSNTALDNYHPAGIPLIPNYIEVVEAGDSLAMLDANNIGKIKLYTWRGPDFINNPNFDMAGVGWILAEDWWPYQRPSFVTPPFAGYVSGHSTFSRAAAEVMTLITGDAYFPGGMGEFEAPMNQFLVFEEGPSVNLTLQWATYRDASDQCSLSRIWGGIHPPCDDIPGRKMGIVIGNDAFEHASKYFDTQAPMLTNATFSQNIINDESASETFSISISFDEEMDTSIIPTIAFDNDEVYNSLQLINTIWVNATTLQANYSVSDENIDLGSINIEILDAYDLGANPLTNYTILDAFILDTDNPGLLIETDQTVYSDAFVGNIIQIHLNFDEVMDMNSTPSIAFLDDNPIENSLSFSFATWTSETSYTYNYTLNDANEVLNNITVSVADARDAAGNLIFNNLSEVFSIDTENPELTITMNDRTINDASENSSLIINFIYSEPMNQDVAPQFIFNGDIPTSNSLDIETSNWWVDNRYVVSYEIKDANESLDNINIQVNNAQDLAGNLQVPYLENQLFTIDTKNPELSISTNMDIVSDENIEEQFFIALEYDEVMDTTSTPQLSFLNDDPTGSSLILSEQLWETENLYTFYYSVVDENIFLENISLNVEAAKDTLGNDQIILDNEYLFEVDTQNPEVLYVETNIESIQSKDIGYGTFNILSIFSEPMNTQQAPDINFPEVLNIDEVLSLNSEDSYWLNDLTYITKYDVGATLFFQEDINIETVNARDLAGNIQNIFSENDLFSIELDPATNVDELVKEALIKVYPNPAFSGENLTISLPEITAQLQIQLFNVSGQTLYSKNRSDLYSNQLTLETQGISTGIYFLYLESEDWQALVRVVIK